MRRALPLLSGLFLLSPMNRASAQSEGDVAAYFALTFTPPGAFAPTPSAARAGEEARGTFALRYGRLSFDGDDGYHNIGIGGDWRAGTGRLGFTVGAVVCEGCELIMLGLDWTTPLVRRAAADGSFGVGLTTAFGAGIPTGDADGMLVSGSLGLPLSMIAGDPNGLRVIPFVTPAVGFGAATGDDGAGGVRAMLGGGVGLVSASGFGISAGVQKVFIEDGEAVLGITVSLGGR